MRYRDYDYEMTYDGDECTGYHREWRNHEADVWCVYGVWHGSMIAYGESDWDIGPDSAEAVAHAFGLLGEDELSEGGHEMFQYYFGGKRVVA